MKNHIRLVIDFYLQNETKMNPKWEGKNGKIWLGAPWAAKGAPKEPQAAEEPQSPKNEAQGSPQTPKIDPKRCPETPKWRPSDPPSSQNPSTLGRSVCSASWGRFTSPYPPPLDPILDLRANVS